MNEEAIKEIIKGVVGQYLAQKTEAKPACAGFEIPIGSSGRHVHLCEADVERLFGAGHTLTPKKAISQPGQFLSEERVTMIGPKGEFRNVAVLGPARKQTQIEVSLTDARALGINAPVAMSGDLSNAADIVLVSETNTIKAEKSVIVAQNHVHMDPESAKAAGLKDGDLVDVRIESNRPLTFNDVVVRAGETHSLEMHIDIDETNACQFGKNDHGYIIGKSNGQAICQSAAEPAPQLVVSAPAKAECGSNEAMISSKYVSEEQIKKFVDGGCSTIKVNAAAIISPLAKDYANRYKVTIERV